ncbi:LCP family protein [Microbispora hainanensis]|uniref:LytR family transcriptional regulator n=1 Tax=Microbispora hainanensis TaxID=568844 RepID=A0A544YWF6_9ACTN|nr:LCP family protein [Microbispora hainanensis]TQS21077.1 LytR family transcriptional regulator [Microbispora hainanensis]
MDDLTMLRDLGRDLDLEYEPSAGLARQRRRLIDETAGGRRRRPAWFTGGRRAGWIAVAAVAAVTAALVVVPTVLLRESTGLHLLAPPIGDRLPKQGQALTVLLLGSDRRPSWGDPESGERSDLMILLRLSADRKRATAVSLPRDSMVRIPQCRSADGRTVAAHTDMINQAYAIGGLTCARKTVESATGVRVDHAVAIRYDGLAKLVDALGGVEVTLPRAVDDPKSKLKLPAGRSVVDGETAVAYARLRYVGDGSDIARIKRNVALMQAMLKKVSRIDTPAAMATLVRVAATSVTTDPALDLDALVTLAVDVRRAGTRFTALTVPWRPYEKDPNRIEWKQPDATRLFARLTGD